MILKVFGDKQNMKVTGIYKIKNIVNGRVYIGASTDVYKRFYQHMFYLRRGEHANVDLQSDYNLYGESNFECSVECECDESELDRLELSTLHKYGGYTSDNTYNMVEAARVAVGECNHNYGKHWSDEWKDEQSRKMKEYLKDKTHHPMYGKHFSEESKKKMRLSQLGKTQSAESNRKRSEKLKGRVFSEEHRRKLSESNHGRVVSQETLSKMRKSMQTFTYYCDDREFISAQELCDYLHTIGYPNITSSTVHSLVKKGFDKSKTYKSLHGRVYRISL